MRIHTSKGKTIPAPSATDVIGALLATDEEETVLVARDLMRFVQATRRAGATFALTLRDRAPDRQITIDCVDSHEAAATLLAFATDADFGARVVDRALAA